MAKQGPGQCAWLPLREALEICRDAARLKEVNIFAPYIGTWRPVSWSRAAFLQTASLLDLHLPSSPRRLQSASASIYGMIPLREGLAKELFLAG